MIGNISVATDPNALNFIIKTRLDLKVAAYKQSGFIEPKCKVIVVDDYDPKQKDFACGSILLPDTNASNCLVEGDMYDFEQFYQVKLMYDDMVREYINTIIAGIMDYYMDYVFYFDFVNNMYMPYIADALLRFLHENDGLIFYNAIDISNNPLLLLEQSMEPSFMQRNRKLIEDAGLNRTESTGVFQKL